MMVFISHAWAYKEAAHRVAKALQEMQVEVWYDAESLMAGSNIEATIEQELESTVLFVLVWSDKAAESAGVRMEVEIAIALDIPMVICRLDDTPVGEVYPALAGLKTINFKQPLTGLNILRSVVMLAFLREFGLEKAPEFGVLKEWAAINEIAGHAREQGRRDKGWWKTEYSNMIQVLEEKLTPVLSKMDEIGELMKNAIEEIEASHYDRTVAERLLARLKEHPHAEDAFLKEFIGMVQAGMAEQPEV
jgi:hypothetical protein